MRFEMKLKKSFLGFRYSRAALENAPDWFMLESLVGKEWIRVIAHDGSTLLVKDGDWICYSDELGGIFVLNDFQIESLTNECVRDPLFDPMEGDIWKDINTQNERHITAVIDNDEQILYRDVRSTGDFGLKAVKADTWHKWTKRKSSELVHARTT